MEMRKVFRSGNSRRKGIIKDVAGCLKDEQLAKDILSLRNQDDRVVVP